MKNFFALSAASFLCAAPAVAGPYVNSELKSSFEGTDYGKSVLYNDIGYEGKLSDTAKYYVQGGPAIVMPDDGVQTTELHLKTGVKLAVTEDLSIYGEVAGLTQERMDLSEDLKVSTKLGFKYKF